MFLDYRDLKEKYDKVASIEMIEAVGEKYLDKYFNTIKKSLNTNGTAAIQGITIRDDLFDRYRSSEDFIQKYIFPGGTCPSFSQIISPIEKTGLIVSDTETLIRHYDKTLESWLERFLDKKREVKDLFDENFVKMWEFYMASCAAAFRYRDLVVFQLQIVKNFQSAHRTRDYIYKT